MPLSAGDRLGPYEILAPLGAGGMGEVYRARDTRLGREVAVKILRLELVDSPDRRRRFELEARAASGLNHPNIITVHDIGDDGAGAPYIVSEVLQGEPLSGVLKRGPLSVRRLLDISVQITDGLAAAHAAGIVHRDLKPDNLFVLPDGRVKILDFGLAKAVSAADEDEETRTLTDLLTSPGMLVGTIAYMSPEQARGDPVDFRSDQFSLGTILYEMAAGKRPFQRADRVATLTAIVSSEPEPLTAVNPPIPAPLIWTIERCLAKAAGQRYASTSDLHGQLQDLRDHLSQISTAAVPVALRPSNGRKTWAALFGMAGIAAGVLLAYLGLPESSQTAYRYTPFATESIDESQPAWSPDGQTLAYVAVIDGIGQVFTRGINSAVPAQITKSAASCSDPFWSPDGTRIYYRAQASLWSVGAAGGAAQMLVPDISGGEHPVSISPDGKALAFFRPEGSLNAFYIQATAGGTPQAYKTPPFPAAFRFSDGVQFSPDGTKLLVSILPGIGIETHAELWVVPYPSGTPRRVPLKTNIRTGFRRISVAWTGDSRHFLLSTEFVPGAGSHIYLIDSGYGEMRSVTAGTGEESSPSLSPDGAKIAFVSGADTYDLMEISLDGAKSSPLLATSRQERSASWSPSGHQFAYVSDATGIPAIWLRKVGENWAEPVIQGMAEGDLGRANPRFSPDGQRLAYGRLGQRHTVWLSAIPGGREVPLEQESSDQHQAAWSPDGNWIAYARYMGNAWQIAKAPSGGGGSPVRICPGGSPSTEIAWSSSGEWIAYQDEGGIFLVPAAGGTPRLLHGPAATFTLSADGATLYVIRRAADRHWELASFNVPEGVQRTSARLDLSPDATVSEMGLRPDGSRFVVSVHNLKRDIWILDGFHVPGRWR
jgi:eukaryotic-like serine/threonine-protein kinase